MDPVPPFRRTFDRETLPAIYPDMSGEPYRRPGDDPGEIGGDLLANFNHAVRQHIRAGPRRNRRRGRIGGPSVSSGGVPVPALQNPLYQVDAIKTECAGGGGVYHVDVGGVLIVSRLSRQSPPLERLHCGATQFPPAHLARDSGVFGPCSRPPFLQNIKIEVRRGLSTFLNSIENQQNPGFC